jgi:hypothetical protein
MLNSKLHTDVDLEKIRSVVQSIMMSLTDLNFLVYDDDNDDDDDTKKNSSRIIVIHRVHALASILTINTDSFPKSSEDWFLEWLQAVLCQVRARFLYIILMNVSLQRVTSFCIICNDIICKLRKKVWRIE